MNVTVVKNAVGLLDQLQSQAKQALSDIERVVFGVRYGDVGGYEYPREAMKAFLEELHDVLLVVLEAAEMPETRVSLMNSWHGFIEGRGLRHTIDSEEFQNCESPALTFLERLIKGLRAAVSEEITSEEAWTLNRLEAMLRDTPALVRRRGKPPKTESDLQKVMHDYLKACFDDFRNDVSIGGTLKNFKPDCGIANVGAAIEFKIVHRKEQIATAFSGVTEDTAGYKGSKDWTRFYAVFYQAEPFMSERHVRSDFKRIGAATWIPIVVNGPTRRKSASRRSSP